MSLRNKAAKVVIAERQDDVLLLRQRLLDFIDYFPPHDGETVPLPVIASTQSRIACRSSSPISRISRMRFIVICIRLESSRIVTLWALINLRTSSPARLPF